MPRYRDRTEAGEALAAALAPWRGRGDVVVLGLPPGGVVVAAAIAAALGAPLDAWVVRDLAVDGVAFGALAIGPVRVADPARAAGLGLDEAAIGALEVRELAELERLEARYRGDEAPALQLEGRCAVLVDDGLAGPWALRAAALAVRERHATEVVVATPAAAPATVAALGRSGVRVVLPPAPERAAEPEAPAAAEREVSEAGVEELYSRPEPVPDAVVSALLARAGVGRVDFPAYR